MTGPLAILADDLTGADDTGVQFSRLGRAVLVLVSLERLPARLEPRWDAIVLNTGSRNLPPAEARARVTAAWDYLQRQALPLVYKKIDSTLRGNLVPELEALFARGVPRAFLAPAFPLNGRTVEGGVLKVGGVPVHETEMGHDGLAPVRSGRIAALLEPAFAGSIGAIGLESLGSAAALAPALAEQERQGRRVVICDAREQRELAVLAEALLPRLPGPVLVGSAGLARELAACLNPEPRAIRATRSPHSPHSSKAAPVLVAAGSRSAVTAEQVRCLRAALRADEARIEPAWVDGVWTDDDGTTGRARMLGERAAALLGAAPPEQAGAADAAEALLLTFGAGEAEVPPARFQERSGRLNLVIGAAILATVARRPLAGLVLTGGDVAAAAIEALGADGIELGAEVLPGIPMGALAGGPHAGLPLVTKAGAFGAPEALTLAVRALRAGGAGSG